ncbi:MAG: hypothetical protein JNL75_03620 [Chitinophagales bacterium]|nr:hypothetical protein [Chitinophagales bacterium]
MNKYIFFIYVLALAFPLDAQLDFSDRKGSINVERFATIHRDRHIIGYVASVNNEHKKTTSKVISILDTKADLIFQLEFINSANYYLIETAFNGSSYAFLFLDVSKRHLSLQVYSLKGVLLREITKSLTPPDIEYFLAHVTHNNNYTGYNQFVQEIGEHGFLLIHHSVEQNLNTCQIFKISPDSSQDKFYTFMTESPIYETNYLGKSKNQIYFSFEIDGSKKGTFFTECIALNIANFNSVFEIKQMKDQDYFFFPKMALTTDTSDQIKLVGYFFEAEKNMEREFYDGFAFWNLDPKGDFKNEKYLSFQKDISDLKFKKDNQGKNLGYLFLQNIFTDGHGSIYLVSEGYQKVAQSAAIGVSVMGMGNVYDYTRVKTYDLALSKFDSDFAYQGSQIIEKPGNAIQLSYHFNQPIFEIGKIYNRYGLFDYLGTEVREDRFEIYFKNFRLEAISGGKFKIGRFTKNKNGTLDFNNVEKLPNTSETYILPNVNGRVLFAEKIKKTIYFDFKN